MNNILKNNILIGERKNAKIINDIFKILQDKQLHTINGLSNKSKYHWKTIKNYIEMILKIQEMPKIEVLKTSNHTLVRIK